MRTTEPTPYPAVVSAIMSSLDVLSGCIEDRCRAGGLTVRQTEVLRDIKRAIDDARKMEVGE